MFLCHTLFVFSYVLRVYVTPAVFFLRMQHLCAQKEIL